MRNNFILVLEIIWIATAVLCLAGSIKSAMDAEIGRSLLFLSMSVVSFGFAWFRHRQRKKS